MTSPRFWGHMLAHDPRGTICHRTTADAVMFQQ
uniref:Uncharacterized protein n=1 Tax=Anguilla anguilla TaxID=7936 RepID=A0A0E9PSU4_ANGAN